MVDIKHSLFYREGSQGRKRWIVSVSVDGAPFRQISAPKIVQAERAAMSWASVTLQGIRERGGALPASAARDGITVGDLFERVIALEAKDKTVRLNTHNAHKVTAKMGAAVWGHRFCAAIDVPAARQFVRVLRDKYAPNTARTVITFAKAAFDVGFAEGWIKVANPFRNRMVSVEIPKAQTLARVPLALSEEAADALVNGPGIPPSWRVRYVLGILVGLGDSEVCGLRVGDVSLDGGAEGVPYVRVERQLERKVSRGLGDVKTENRDRYVPLSPGAVDALRWWLGGEWSKAVATIGREVPRAVDPLLPSLSGRGSGIEFTRPAKISEHMRAHLVALGHPSQLPGKGGRGLHNVTFHAARRTFASLLQAAGVTDADVGAMMGHAGSTVTATNYIRRDLQRLSGEVSKHPIGFSFVRVAVRTADRAAQRGVAKALDRQGETMRLEREAQVSRCFSGNVRGDTQSAAENARCLAERALTEYQTRGEDHAHSPETGARTARTVRGADAIEACAAWLRTATPARATLTTREVVAELAPLTWWGGP